MVAKQKQIPTVHSAHIHTPVTVTLTSVGEVGVALSLNAVGSHCGQ